MTLRLRIALLLIAVIAFAVWKTQLFIVSRPGEAPLPLTVRAAADRPGASFDVTLAQIPIGARHLTESQGVTVIHYWAPWERHSASQAAALDSLTHMVELAGLNTVVVCFDPFPSVTRYVARQRLRLCVLLDHGHDLRRALPCPSIPFTYVIDRNGRVAVAQAGEVDWLDPATRTALRRLLTDPIPATSTTPPSGT